MTKHFDENFMFQGVKVVFRAPNVSLPTLKFTDQPGSYWDLEAHFQPTCKKEFDFFFKVLRLVPNSWTWWLRNIYQDRILFWKVFKVVFKVPIAQFRTYNTIFKPHVMKFWHNFSSAQIGPKQLNLMTKNFHQNFMFKGVKGCFKVPNLNQTI